MARRHAIHELTDSGLAEFLPDLSRQGCWMVYLNDIQQSYVDLEDPTYLEFEYVRRIGHLIDLAFPEGRPVRALHLGGGAMTLARYIAVTRPGSPQLVAETDARLTELVRRHLPMPGGKPRVRVRPEDARAVLESVRAGSYDLVIGDVYDGPRTPSHLATSGLAKAAARALRDDGVYTVNVADGPPLKHVRDQIATLREVFGHCWLIAEAGVLRGRRRANLVLAAGQRELPAADLRRRCAGDPFPARVLDGAELSRFARGAQVVTDESASSG